MPPPDPSRRRDVMWAPFVGAGIIFGVVARVVVLRSHLGTLDSDEAIVGLMARDVTHGRFRTFFWGQPYGGSLESILSAPAVAVSHTTVVGLKLVPIALSAVAAVLVWRIGERVLGRWPGRVAGVIAWCWPANFVWWSTKATGFYEALLVCSMGLVLAAIRFVQDGPSRRDAIAFGLLAGIGWWLSPQVVYAAAPATVWVAVSVVRRRGLHGLAPVTWAVPAFVLGSAPWLVFVARNGLLPLDSRYEAGTGGYLSHLKTFARDGVPTVLGTRVLRQTHAIPASRLFLAFIAVAALVALWARRPRAISDPWVLVLAAGLAYPLILAVSKNASYVGEGRYEFFLAPWVALLLAGAARRASFGAVTIAVLCVATAIGVYVPPDGITSPDVGGKVVPREVAPAVRALEDLGDLPAWSDYWIAMRVRYQSDGRILVGSTNQSRDRAAEPKVASAPRSAWLFVAGTAPEASLVCNLHRLGWRYESVDARPFRIIIPEHPLEPASVRPCTT